MSTEQTSTPQHDPAAPKRQITVDVPEDRVEQFQAFYERFLAISERRAGGRPHGRGRHGGHRRHHIRRAMYHLAMAEHGPGPRHGRCGRRQAEDAQATTGTIETA
jgi:hypothetical protein